MANPAVEVLAIYEQPLVDKVDVEIRKMSVWSMQRLAQEPDISSAAAALSYRLWTDAVFHQDIRCITLIIDRLDGGVPAEADVDSYETSFADCLNKVLACTERDYITVFPDDTALMALAKSLFDIATSNIYYNLSTRNRRKPNPEEKRERDAAMRIVLERSGGRKGKTAKTTSKSFTEPEWIKGLLE